jgi:hypothetical protein
MPEDPAFSTANSFILDQLKVELLPLELKAESPELYEVEFDDFFSSIVIKDAFSPK